MPKTYRYLWQKVISFEALHAAYLRARRGKRFTPDVLKFSTALEVELLSLRSELLNKTYSIGAYYCFQVWDPKKREVAALPFRDRVVQHALMFVIEPIYEARFIHDSYACRVGKGTHAGADRLTKFLRYRHRTGLQTYVLKGDISNYFLSIDQSILRSLLHRHIKCKQTLWLLDKIIKSWSKRAKPGIPIGNLTSQLFANVYLHELDKFVKHELRCKHYLRYVDDFILLGSDKKTLNQNRTRIDQFLNQVLRLRLNPKTSIFPEARGVDFLGYRIWRTHRLLRKRSVYRMRRKLKLFAYCYARGEMSIKEIEPSITAWLGHACHANTYKLRRHLLNSTVFQHDSKTGPTWAEVLGAR